MTNKTLQIEEIVGSVLVRSEKPQYSFMTSLDVIQQVMNVPQCALTSLLRGNGYGDVEPVGNCINEKMLTVFSEAYVRKMRNYYTQSLRHFDQLSIEEAERLRKFTETFKKTNLCNRFSFGWELIDTQLIEKAFVEKVRSLTRIRSFETLLSDLVIVHKEPIKETPYEKTIEKELRRFVLSIAKEFNIAIDDSDIISLVEDSLMIEDYSLSGFTHRSDYEFDESKGVLQKALMSQRNDILDIVVHSRFYVANKIEPITKPHIIFVSNIRFVYLAGRYHIFVPEDLFS